MTWLVWLLALVMAGCLDSPLADEGPQAKIVAEWDPLQCGEPHRIAVELEDTDGGPISASTNCGLGTLTLDARHYGIYRGSIYAWSLGVGKTSPTDIHLTVDEPIVHWYVPTPR
ncbi:MAG TPA: hypothetical protein VGC41_26165 [Kofleriaceae bacterium]